MARVISADLLARLQAGRIVKTDILLFDFPSGLFGFHSGQGRFSYNGVDYVGAGGLFEIDAIGGGTDGAAIPLTIKLNAAAQEGLTMTVLATVEQEQYRGRPVTISRAYFDADTYELVSVEPIYRGYIDTIDHVETGGGDGSDGEAYLEAHVESRALDLGRSGWRRRSDADQRQLDVDDGSLRYLQTTAVSEIWWGRLPPARARGTGGSSKFILPLT